MTTHYFRMRLARTACLLLLVVSSPALRAQEHDAMPGMDSKTPPAPASTSLTLTLNGKATTFSSADLAALPQKTIKVHNEHNKADETYTGVALSDLLGKAGFAPSQATHRQLLRSYIQAEGTDHYWVLYALTEVEPSEHLGDVIVATSLDGHPLGADGQFKLVSSEDRKPQRWVRNLASITVKSAE